ncbi:MAG: hypothetical protein P4L26_17785 [Terracidiphilus sp.]|jgi:hypothetical protein|nr:hypothetical protein [Terracidiphilus sp.]
MPEILRSKDFAPQLNTIFRIETPAAHELELVEVTDRSNETLAQFSIMFAGPESPWLEQGTYTLLHPAMGQVTLFMGPKGPRDGRMIYEAAFSRLIALSPQTT